jgi:hypothetical protein
LRLCEGGQRAKDQQNEQCAKPRCRAQCA